MKALKLFFVAALLLPLLSGCKEDEPSSTDMLIGNWYSSEYDEIHLFKSHGVYIGYEDVDLKKGTYADIGDGTWRFDSAQNVIIVEESASYDGDRFIYKVVHASENELILCEYDDYYDDWDSPEVYRRISDYELPTRESY